MPGRIPPTFIDELLARTDIVEVIGSRIELRRSGQNHKGLCPFHGEKTPSFNVNANKQFYYCFGCQALGHALKFLMEYEHLEFPAAVETLAGMVGLEVPREAQDARTEERQRRRKPILEMLAAPKSDITPNGNVRLTTCAAAGSGAKLQEILASALRPPGAATCRWPCRSRTRTETC